MVFTVTARCTGPHKCHSAWWEEGTKMGSWEQDHPGDNVFHSHCTVTTCRFKSNPTIPYPDSGVRDRDSTVKVWRSKTQHALTLTEEHSYDLGMRGRGERKGCWWGYFPGKSPREEYCSKPHRVAEPSCGQPDPG